MNPFKTPDTLERDVSDVVSTAENVYSRYFEKYFKRMRYLHKQYADPTCDVTELKISDSELESALTDLPLELFGVSEELSKFRLKQGVIKLKAKDLEAEAKKDPSHDTDLLDYCKLEISICNVIISRVEQEISFSREFIMVLKKLWDSRRATDKVNPISEKNYELPEYDPLSISKKQQGGTSNGDLQGLDF